MPPAFSYGLAFKGSKQKLVKIFNLVRDDVLNVIKADPRGVSPVMSIEIPSNVDVRDVMENYRADKNAPPMYFDLSFQRPHE